MIDTDGDGWADLLEYALATDPGERMSEDALASRMPNLTQVDTVNTTNGIERSMNLEFQVAPWFEWNENQFVTEDFEVIWESSTDLVNWELKRSSYYESNSRVVTARNFVPKDIRGNWMRVRVKKRE